VKFVIGFLLAFSVMISLVGVAVADCACNQDPAVFGGGWGKTPPECLLPNGCSVSVDWQKEIMLNRIQTQQGHQPWFYMNPDAQYASIVLYGGPNIPVFHADWYYYNPSYYSEWYRNPDGTLPSMAVWNSLSIEEKYGWVSSK
jgi:hypothetical protein